MLRSDLITANRCRALAMIASGATIAGFNCVVCVVEDSKRSIREPQDVPTNLSFFLFSFFFQNDLCADTQFDKFKNNLRC